MARPLSLSTSLAIDMAIVMAIVTAIAMLLAVSLPANAKSERPGTTIHGWVSLSGELRLSSGARSSLAQTLDCQSNPNLAFSFAETASPEQLTLDLDGPRQGMITVELTITDSCGSGSASFEYRHESLNDLPGFGPGITVSPASTQLSLPLQAGASRSLAVSYSMDGERALSSRWQLVGDGISFIVGESFGQAARRRALAQINFRGSVVITEDFSGRQLRRLRDAGDALNRACRRSEEGTRLREVCETIREQATTTSRQQQAARAFDGNALAALARAADQGGKVQNRNVNQRLAERRAGSTGISTRGLGVSFNGYYFDQSILPLSLQNNEQSGGGRLLGERWGAFINGDIVLGKRDDRDKEPSLDYDSWGITAGIDYRFDSGSVIGLATGYGRGKADIDLDDGESRSDHYSLQLFGTMDLAPDLYIDATLGTIRGSFDQDRVVDLSGIGSLTRDLATGSTDTREWSASLALNYRWQLESGWTLTPFARFFYADIEIDGFTESGSVFNFSYPDQSVSSEQWSMGLRASRAISLERAIMLPFINLAWQHESGLDGYLVQPNLAATSILGPTVELSDPDRNTGRIDIGLSWVFQSGNQLFINYSGLLMDRDRSENALFLGARREF